jgi:hypothetical protein
VLSGDQEQKAHGDQEQNSPWNETGCYVPPCVKGQTGGRMATNDHPGLETHNLRFEPVILHLRRQAAATLPGVL